MLLGVGLIASALSNPAYAATIHPGDPGVFQFGNSLYTWVLGPKWTEAEANAVAIGGHLVTFNSLEEAQWTFDIFAVGPGAGDSGMWNGFTDREVEGDWKWISGVPVTFTAWGAGQPDNFNDEDYAGGFTGWGDANNDGLGLTVSYMRGLAEVPLPSSPISNAPSPMPVFGAVAAYGYSRKLRKRIKRSACAD